MGGLPLQHMLIVQVRIALLTPSTFLVGETWAFGEILISDEYWVLVMIRIPTSCLTTSPPEPQMSYNFVFCTWFYV